MCAYAHIAYMFNCSVFYTIFYESNVPVYKVSMKCKQLKSQYTTCEFCWSLCLSVQIESSLAYLKILGCIQE